MYQHTTATQGLEERCFASNWEGVGICAVMDVLIFLVTALLSPETAQLYPFASTSWGRYNSRKLLSTPATYYNAETFLKLSLMCCLCPACSCLDALRSTMCLSHYWNGKPGLKGSCPFHFTFNWKLGGVFFPTFLPCFFFYSLPVLIYSLCFSWKSEGHFTKFLFHMVQDKIKDMA